MFPGFSLHVARGRDSETHRPQSTQPKNSDGLSMEAL